MDYLDQYRRINEYVGPGIDQIKQGASAVSSGDLSGIMSILGGSLNSGTGFIGANIANMAPEFIATQGGVYGADTGRDKLARDLALLMQIGGLSDLAPAIAKTPMQNVVVEVPVGRAGTVLEGRLPSKPDDITHAYRSMSQKELDYAKKSGFFHPPKNPKFNENQKWWSPGDESGQFGRTWKGGDAAEVRVRVPINLVPNRGPVKYKDIEVLDHQTGSYLPSFDNNRR